MSKRVADLLVETLQAAGVKTCYGIVGDTLNRIAHAIDHSDIDRTRGRRGELDFSALPRRQVLTPISAVFSGKRLEPSPTRPSKILATNSETVGFQDHPLRQPLTHVLFALGSALGKYCLFIELCVVFRSSERRPPCLSPQVKHGLQRRAYLKDARRLRKQVHPIKAP